MARAQAVEWSRACDRALAYPFAQPRGPFIFTTSGAVYHDEPDFAPLLARAMAAPRVAVIACGSNASPARLAEKFIAPRLLRAPLVPTLSVTLRGHVVTHSAKFCSYAAMPATLYPWPGAAARLYVSLLDAEELAAMDATEALGDEYDRVTFDAASVSGLPEGVRSVEAYVSRRAGGQRRRASGCAGPDRADPAPGGGACHGKIGRGGSRGGFPGPDRRRRAGPPRRQRPPETGLVDRVRPLTRNTTLLGTS
jgi:hypothetical protein